MAIQIFDENKIREMSAEIRFKTCKEILENERDESKRWDAVWMVGELIEGLDEKNNFRSLVADLFEWVLRNDTNGVVKHEASFQIAARNLRQKIPVLTDIALNDTSMLSRHEAIEALGLMRAFETEDIIKKIAEDSCVDIRETAKFVVKRFQRLKECGEYIPSSIL